MKVKAIMGFNDLEANKERNVGDVFEVSKERANFLMSRNAVVLFEEEVLEPVVEDIKDEEIEETKEEEIVEEVVEEKPKKKKK